jgi:superfamily II DNA or RNA helicase
LIAVPIRVTVRSRLECEGLSPELDKALRAEATHSNPDYGKARAQGRWVGNVPRTISTWSRRDDGALLLARGMTSRLRELATEHGERIAFFDRRVSMPSPWPKFIADPGNPDATPRAYQVDAENKCVALEQGIVRAPTGAGKTHIALSAFARIGQRTLIIARDRHLLEQWVEKAARHLGMESPLVGVIRGGRKHRIGTCLTLALQQTLYAKGFPLEKFAQQFGAVGIDEVQTAAARTVQNTIDPFPARFRIGFSADESRKDRKEFLIYDLFGEVIYDVTRAEMERDRYTCPVVVRLVPTAFKADWYRDAPSEERDYGRLLEEMIADEDRGRLLRQVVLDLAADAQVPAFVFCHRREHASRVSTELLADGIASGLMMGGDSSATAFDEARALLESGRIKVAVGTFNAIGTGIDIPNVRAGVVGTPLGANRQFFNQVRGRICRPAKGKVVGYLYYLWDREVFPFAPRNLIDWNDGRVEVFDHDSSKWVEADGRGSPR